MKLPTLQIMNKNMEKNHVATVKKVDPKNKFRDVVGYHFADVGKMVILKKY